MTLKGLSTLIAILSTSAVLAWTLAHRRTVDTPKVINKVRSYSVLNLTWARVENWRKDQNETPCVWVCTQSVPVFGTFEVDCLVDGESWARFDVSADMKRVQPANPQTVDRLKALADWARNKKRYP